LLVKKQKRVSQDWIGVRWGNSKVTRCSNLMSFDLDGAKMRDFLRFLEFLSIFGENFL
jgi:hypothetical protein